MRSVYCHGESNNVYGPIRTHCHLLGLNWHCRASCTVAHIRHYLPSRMEDHDGYHVSFSSSRYSSTRLSTDILTNRIPVYIINALYLWPITVWTYVKYGRPDMPKRENEIAVDETDPLLHSHHRMGHGEGNTPHQVNGHHNRGVEQGPEAHGNHHHHHDSMSANRPIFASITIATCHCGAGCVLGDIIGEWLVYRLGATVGGSMLYAAFIVGKSAPIIILVC